MAAKSAVQPKPKTRRRSIDPALRQRVWALARDIRGVTPWAAAVVVRTGADGQPPRSLSAPSARAILESGVRSGHLLARRGEPKAGAVTFVTRSLAVATAPGPVPRPAGSAPSITRSVPGSNGAPPPSVGAAAVDPAKIHRTLKRLDAPATRAARDVAREVVAGLTPEDRALAMLGFLSARVAEIAATTTALARHLGALPSAAHDATTRARAEDAA